MTKTDPIPDSQSNLEAIEGSKDRLFSVFGEQLHSDERVVYPETAEQIAFLLNEIARFKLQGGHILLVDGAFDVPHPNHEWYLRHCRAIAAERQLIERGIRPTAEKIRERASSNSVRVIVTVDADEKISRKKGNDPAKGGVPRPIYPWGARAHRVAGYAFGINGSKDFFKPVVDLVTVEGDPTHAGTPLESSLTLADCLKEAGLLDTLVIFGEHASTVNEASRFGSALAVIPESINYEEHPLTGQTWKSSQIIRRAQGKA